MQLLNFFIGICCKPQQAQTNPGHFAAQPGEACRIPNEVPHWQGRRRTIQWREGIPN